MLAFHVHLALCVRSRSADPTKISYYSWPGAMVFAGIQDGAGTFPCSSLVIQGQGKSDFCLERGDFQHSTGSVTVRQVLTDPSVGMLSVNLT